VLLGLTEDQCSIKETTVARVQYGGITACWYRATQLNRIILGFFLFFGASDCADLDVCVTACRSMSTSTKPSSLNTSKDTLALLLADADQSEVEQEAFQMR
jgi:hypothetical protein